MISNRWRAIGAVLVLVVAGLAARPSAQATGSSRILVMPFDNPLREASIVWLGEAAAVLLADTLNAIGASAIAREERREAFEQLQVPANAMLTDATVIRIGQLVGAAEVITEPPHVGPRQRGRQASLTRVKRSSGRDSCRSPA